MTTHKRQRQSRWRRVPLENLAMSTAPQPAKTGAFGERMRREREMRGIKLEEIAESTKIGKRNLEALEQERFDQLPGGIFNKGFVRAYAKYLGLDEEQAVNDFLAASANYDQPSALAPPIPATWVKPPAMPSEASIRRKNRLWALTALLALVAGFALWFYYARVAQSGSRVAQPPSAVLERWEERQPPAAPCSSFFQLRSCRRVETPLQWFPAWFPASARPT